MDNLKKKLQSMSVTALRKEISKQNVKGYSKLKKADIINLMLINSDRFMYLVKQVKKEEKKEESVEQKLKRAKELLKKKQKELKKKNTHKMPDGTVMTGKTHNKDSKSVKKSKPYSGERDGQKVDPDIGITEKEAEQITGMKSSKKNCPSDGKEPRKPKDKKDFKKLTLIYHPDKNQGCPKEAEIKFKKLVKLFKTNTSEIPNNEEIKLFLKSLKQIQEYIGSKDINKLSLSEQNEYVKDGDSILKIFTKVYRALIGENLKFVNKNYSTIIQAFYQYLNSIKSAVNKNNKKPAPPPPKKSQSKPAPKPAPKKEAPKPLSKQPVLSKTEKEFIKVDREYKKVKEDDKRFTRGSNLKMNIKEFNKIKNKFNEKKIKLSNLRLDLLDKIKLQKEKQLEKDIKDFIKFVKSVIKNPNEKQIDEIYDNELFDEIPEDLEEKLDALTPPIPKKKKNK